MRTTDPPEVQERATWSRPELRVLDVGGSGGKPISSVESYQFALFGTGSFVGPS